MKVKTNKCLLKNRADKNRDKDKPGDAKVDVMIPKRNETGFMSHSFSLCD